MNRERLYALKLLPGEQDLRSSIYLHRMDKDSTAERELCFRSERGVNVLLDQVVYCLEPKRADDERVHVVFLLWSSSEIYEIVRFLEKRKNVSEF